MATNKIREEEVKNIIRQEFFQDYDATPILGACKWLKFTSAYKALHAVLTCGKEITLHNHLIIKII